MKPKYLEAPPAQRDRWMISYVDVLTILLVFFIAVAAKTLFARTDPAPPPPAAASTPAPPPPPTAVAAPSSAEQPPRSPLADAFDRLKEQGIAARMEPRGLVISLAQTVLYSSGEDQVSRDAIPVVEQVVEVLRTLPNHITLIGHADSQPIHNQRFKSNWELSAARGLRLLELLITRYRIDESRLSVSSDGANQPASPNDTPEGRADNRRVEIVIMND
jgi:chemotaxis protein MotB